MSEVRCGPADAFRSRYGPHRTQHSSHGGITKFCATATRADTGTREEEQCQGGYGAVRRKEEWGLAAHGERGRHGYVRLWASHGESASRRLWGNRHAYERGHDGVCWSIKSKSKSRSKSKSKTKTVRLRGPSDETGHTSARLPLSSGFQRPASTRTVHSRHCRRNRHYSTKHRNRNRHFQKQPLSRQGDAMIGGC